MATNQKAPLPKRKQSSDGSRLKHEDTERKEISHREENGPTVIDHPEKGVIGRELVEPDATRKAAANFIESHKKVKELIDEILKTTPHLAMSLSLKSEFAKDKIKIEQTPELPEITVKTEDKSQRELSQSQKERLFFELKQVKDPNGENEEFNDASPLSIDDQKGLEKIMNSLKNIELVVSERKDESHDQSNEHTLDLKKPEAVDKSPIFVRKVDSGINSAPSYSSNAKDKQEEDEEDLEALVNLSVGESDYAFSMRSGFCDDSMVPENGRVMTSHIGRRSACQSRASAVSRSDTYADEWVETIQWKRGNLLGKGAYGQVWCGLTNKGELIAVKQIELNINDMEQAEEEYEKIQEEVELLKSLKHPNIIGYLGTSLEDNFVNIFMQFVPGGSIANILARFGALEEDVFRLYTKQILKGVVYLHQNNVIHRDIKGGNIMVMHNGIIKLIDFGCAKRLCLKIKTLNNDYMLKSMRGTPYWMAPEVVKETGYGIKSDIWSIGCTVYEMATRKPPWADLPPMAAIFAIGSDVQIMQLPIKFSREARDFVRLCMDRDQDLRPSAASLLRHPFLQTKRRK